MFGKSFGAAALLASSAIFQGAEALYSATANNNVAVYWGQNGYGNTTQDNLLTACNNTNVDIVVMSFVTKFKGASNYPVINLSDQCWTTFPNATNTKLSTDILHCPTVGTYITQCQALGKKVLLSIGGSTYKGNDWKDAASARSSANEIWSMFGPPSSSNPFPYRPFDNAVVDGFDLDMEYAANAPNMESFAAQLKAKYALDKKRTYMLTAAPQCPNPDSALDKALTTVPFDAVFIQFYNNPCQMTSWKSGKAQTSNAAFNLQMWQTWATTKSANKSIKLFTGFLAGGAPGQTGYVSKATAVNIVTDSRKFANYGGASFWDNSILNVNSAYLPGVRAALNQTKKKRSAEPEADIKHPVNEETVWPEKEGAFAKAEADVSKIRRRHAHRHGRRGF